MARQMKDSGIEWIGEIPETWDIIKFKYLFLITGGNGFPESLQGKTEGAYPFCKVSDINGHSDYVDAAANYVSDEVVAAHSFNIIPSGSIIIAKIGAALQKNHRKINSVPCCIDNNTQALVPIRADSIRYLLYLTRCIDMGWFDNNSTVPSLNNNKLLNFFVPNVSVDEQHRIAAFLDRKCAEIDTVIERTKATIEEYKKLKQAVITEAVTKGVRGARKMKDSGMAWVPELPEEWHTIPSKFLFRNSDTRRQPDDEQLTASQKYGIISQAEYMEREGAKVVLANKGLEDWKHVEPNDFIISLRSFQGGLEMSEVSGCITWHYIVLKPCKTIVSKYFKWLFKSEVYIKALQRTCNFIRDGQDLRYSNFVQVPLYEPSLEEQQEIADYLDVQCAEMDTLIAKKTALLTEMETYKKSLIYEYVTGKKEVV